jgi:DNA primase
MTVVDDIKGRLDILEVVSQHVALQRSGRSYKANCPFHQERTPSFHVFPDRQTWRCFGACAAGGDVFTFVMRAGNLEFAEALRQLAQQTGVALPSRERRTEQGFVLQINEAALTYFQELLFSEQGAGARDYLERRRLSKDAIRDFELGLSPLDGESLKNHLVGAGYSPQQLAAAGVVSVTDNGRARDLFRNRLMIPIRNSRGELGGFGGRALGDATPKYLNSPRTSLFDKGSLLYGLYLAKEEAGRKGLVVVEGYMDVISAHQHGFNNVVASMGTALTQEQVSEIRRITADVTMALDPDAAGQQATLRSLESSWRVFQSSVAGHSQGTTLYQRQPMLELKIAILPDGQDPDDVIQRSPGEWAQLVDGAAPYMEYLFGALSAQVDPSTPQGKARMVELMFPLIAAVPEPTQQDHYFQALAEHLGVTQDTLRATIGRPSVVRRGRGTGSQARGATPSPFAKLERDPMEDYCLALLLQNSGLGEAVEELRPEYFRRLENREIFNQWDQQRRGDQGATALASLRACIDEELAGQLETLVQKSLPPLDQYRRLHAVQDAVHRLEERYLRELKTEEGIRFAETPPDLAAASNQGVLEVNQRLKSNQSKRKLLVPDVKRRG